MGLEDGSIVKGEISVSIFNNSRAKIVTDSREKIPCIGYVSRNRSLNGDKVYAKLVGESPCISQISPSESSEVSDVDILDAIKNDNTLDESRSITCKVVGISERVDQRFVSRLRPNESLVQPRDPRYPAMRLNENLPVTESCLTLVKFADWSEFEQYPSSSLIRLLGPEGSFPAEDDASLEIAGLLSEKYSPEIDDELGKLFPSSESVIANELSRRTDIRNTPERVFTIDPPTAKDLDDAISISPIKDQIYRIGVHVADVSFFVPQGSYLDNEAFKRTTSVYLPRQVYPMLPPYLSENLCSLLPMTDRLAFSVYYKINAETGVLVDDPEFVRTIIRSTAKLSYDDVDHALDVGNGDEKISAEIFSDIKILLEITRKMRENRIANGSISIDDRNGAELKLEFAYDEKQSEHPVALLTSTTMPSSGHDSHTLIEELMVQTNMLVADKLVASPGLIPVVRRHVETESAVVESARNFLLKANVKIPEDVTSITGLLMTAKRELTPSMFTTLTHSILGDFSRAEYIVPSGADDVSNQHWGVGAKRYMHFTSPIRRYADLIVHRKLGDLISGPQQSATENVDELVNQLRRCNTNAKAAQEAESNNKMFYFSTFVRSFGTAGFPVEAIVKDLIAPQDGKGIKGSVLFFIPIIGDVKSQSLESLGLDFVDMVHDEKISSITACNSRTKEPIEIRLFDTMKMRAFTKRETTPIPKFYLKFPSSVPPPTRKRRRSKGSKK